MVGSIPLLAILCAMGRDITFWFPQPKDPDEILDYQFDWSKFIQSEGIQSYSVTATGVDIIATDVDPGNQKVNLRVSGGQDGTPAVIQGTITTTSGQIVQRTAKLRITQR